MIAGVQPASGPEIVLIAALDRNGAIGRDGGLPWHLPDDLKRFKALTLGRPILMGRKTAQSLGRALPGRKNIVLSRAGKAPFADMHVVDTLASALMMSQDSERLCVIGGGEIYAVCLPFAQRMNLTFVDVEVTAADTYFPTFEASDWEVERQIKHAADARHACAFAFIDYQRRAVPEASSTDAR